MTVGRTWVQIPSAHVKSQARGLMGGKSEGTIGWAQNDPREDQSAEWDQLWRSEVDSVETPVVGDTELEAEAQTAELGSHR